MGKTNFNTKIGKNLLMGALLTGAVIIPMNNVNAASTDAPTITYQAHVENKGWMDKVSTSTKDAYAGTQGQALRMEALRIKLEGLDDVTLSYKAHIENIGDKEFDSDAEIIGTEGQALRLEAITVNADGIEDTDYSLQYRVHIENEGTTGWVNAGEEAGSRGKAQRLESIEFRLLSKTEQKAIEDREKAIAQMKEEFKPEDYTINKTDYDKVLAEAIKEIEETDDYDAMVDIVVEFRDNFDTSKGDGKYIKSDKEELGKLTGEAAKNVGLYVTYITTLSSDASMTDEDIKNAVIGTQKEGIALINSSTTVSEATRNLDKAKELAVKAVKEIALKKLDSLYYDGDKDENYIKEDAYNTAVKAIKAAKVSGKDTSTIAIATDYNTAVGAGNLVSLADIKSDAITGTDGIETYVTAKFSKTGTYKEATAVLETVKNAKDNINNAKTRTSISSYLKSAKETALRQAKTYLLGEVDKVYGGGNKAVDGQFVSESTYIIITDAINKAETIDGTDGVIAAYEALTPVDTEAETKYETLKTFATDAKAKSKVNSILADAEIKLYEATDKEIDDMLDDYKKQIMKAESSYYEGLINSYTKATFKYDNGTGEKEYKFKTSVEDPKKDLKDAIKVVNIADQLLSSNDTIAELKSSFETALASVADEV